MSPIIYLLIWGHFVGDFVLQSDAMAKGKGCSNLWLGKHIGAYALSLFLILYWKVPAGSALVFCLTNGAAHFLTDYATSRVTRKLWAEKRVHDFFVVIGLDQAIHLTTLIWTFNAMRLS